MKPSLWITTALFAAAAAVTAPHLARADVDPDLQGLRAATGQMWNAVRNNWADKAADASKACVAEYDKLRAAGSPDSRTVGVYAPLGDQKNGDVITIKQMRDVCVATGGNLAKDKLRSYLRDAIGSANATLGESNPSATRLAEEGRSCAAAVKAALEGGIDAGEKLESSTWTGPVGAVQAQVCDKAATAADQAIEKMLAPYKAAGMSGDKLAMIKENGGSTLYQIAGGESTLDPQKLTKANVWFEFFEGDECARGKIETMHRYQFDKNGKLVKNTVREFCGDPPKSAYK
jgi:hypothetical protein